MPYKIVAVVQTANAFMTVFDDSVISSVAVSITGTDIAETVFVL